MNKRVLIIGGGIAGLSAGCYARMNGFDTLILEMHRRSGGVCTGWKRGPFTTEGCIHWLMGTNPHSSFYQIWQELGALQGKKLFFYEEFGRIRAGDRMLIVHSDLDALEKSLKEISPADSSLIEELIDTTRDFCSFEMPLDRRGGLKGLWDNAVLFRNLAPYLSSFRKFLRTTVREFAEKFQSGFLQQALPMIIPVENLPLISLVIGLAALHTKNAGFPEGGSIALADAIESRYDSLGGVILFNKKVEEILVENGAAAGAKTADGEVHRANIVISAADGHSTLFEMLGGRHTGRNIEKLYDTLPRSYPILLLSLGIAQDFSREPHSLIWKTDKPMETGGISCKRMNFRHYTYDRTFAPSGKSVLVSMLPTDFRFWQDIYHNRERYTQEKNRIIEAFTGELDRWYPGIRSRIETADVATPMTYVRYTGNHEGQRQGWAVSPDTFGKKIPAMLAGLKNFHMAGQWIVIGGGIPVVAQSGRDCIKKICRLDGKKFVAGRP